MKIKFCGFKREEDVRDAILAGADYIGFVTEATSSRRNNILEKTLLLTKHGKKYDKSKKVKFVSVLVDPYTHTIDDLVGSQIDTIQIHEPSPDLITYLAEFDLSSKKEVWFAYSTSDRLKKDVISQIKRDTKIFKPGGILLDGISIQEKILGKKSKVNNSQDIYKKLRSSPLSMVNNSLLILAGGINIENIEKFIDQKPDIIDISSGIENKIPGNKDKEKMEKIIKKVKENKDKKIKRD